MSEGTEETVAQSPQQSDEPEQKTDTKTKTEEAPPDCIVKLRGLPWSSTAEDIMSFFSDCEILNGRNGIHIVMTRDNRPTGEAYVEMSTSDDLNKALKHDRNHIGSRYIEVFRTRQSEFEWSIKRQNNGPTNEDACVKLRGLPFNCTKEEIATFFGGLELIPNGITLLMDGTGRSNGEAYVQFASMDNADQALKKHREKIGHRYIEIFRSSASDVRRYNNQRYFNGSMGGSGGSMMSGMNQRPGPYDRNMDRMNRYQNSSRSSRGFKDVDIWDSLNGSNGMSRDMPSRGGSMMGSGRFSSDMGGRMDGGGMGRLGVGMGGGFGGRMMDMDRMGNNMGMMGPGDRMGMGNMRGMLGSGMGMSNMSGGMGNMGMSNNDRMSNGNNWNNNSGGGFGDNGAGGHYVHMRGLPYKARTSDIIEFFKPVVPIDILIKCQRNGRSTGTADVEFRTHSDALEAMTKDKSKMEHRYIELFLNSNNSMRGLRGSSNF